ncbi:hypothetical protein K438DRAFT_1799643 [Mycena galopus ATCC 62051]|nr:hypothetical protein K438DRAFT_1799643 [Mycena galopus ATCC 62051]
MRHIQANSKAAHDAEPLSEVLPSSSKGPIYTLPYELLAYIMVLSLTPRINSHGHEIKATSLDVVNLCRVCCLWTDVAADTRKLWVVAPFPLVEVDYDHCKRTKLFLELSDPLPISVCIPPLKPWSGFKLVPLGIPPIVADTVLRWKTLEIDYPDSYEFHASILAGIPPDGLENLEILVLRWREPEIWQGPKLNIFRSVPRLRDVTIQGSHIPPMPWSQLTRLSLTHDSPQLCIDALVRCKSIVSASITTKEWSDDPDSSNMESDSLSYLEELEIQVWIRSHGEHLGPFLQQLGFPALKSLTCSLGYYDGFYDEVSSLTPALLSLSTRSPNLAYLKIDTNCDGCVCPSDVAEILAHIPNLTKLHFSNWEVDEEDEEDFFGALRYSDTDAVPLVPKLETLVLAHMVMRFGQRLVEMIKSRWWSDELLAMPTAPRIARLKCLKLSGSSTPGNVLGLMDTPELAETMAVYRSQGLVIL